MNTYHELQRLLKKQFISTAIINSPENIYYFTGLTPNQLTVSRSSYFAALVINEDKEPLLTTMDYEYGAFIDTENIKIKPYTTWVGLKTEEEVINKTKNELIAGSSIEIIKENISTNSGVIGVEMAFITPDYLNSLKEAIPGAKFVDISSTLIEMRSIKTLKEVEEFRQITKICDEALLEMAKNIETGITEKELIQHYRNYIYKDGKYLPSGWTMLGFGTNSAALSRPTNRILKSTDSIRFDGGANADFEFFTTDFSRSWLMPDADPLLKEIKPVLYKAQRLMIESIKPGMKFSELFQVGFNAVKGHYPNYTRGHLGHSISLGPQTAEAPIISPDNTDTIKENMILCIEVPLYITDLGGFNIEDMVLVTKDGCEVLTYRTPHFLDWEKE